MSHESIERLREMQLQIERAASTVSTRQDLINYRSLWGQLQELIDKESEPE
jgi:hypothetical protein